MQEKIRLPGEFLLWWLVTIPKRIFIAGKRLLVLVNSSLSFTLNLRLIFTPLYGDFSLVGRFIGFTIRVFEIVFGLFFVAFLALGVLILPLIWYLTPIILFSLITFWTLPVMVFTYFLWAYSTKDIPLKKAAQVKPEEKILSFRPRALKACTEAQTNFRVLIKKLATSPEITSVLNRAELNTEEFIDKLLALPEVDTSRLIEASHKVALEQKTRYVEIEQVFLSIISGLQKPDVFLSTFGSNLDQLQKTIEWILSEKERLSRIYFWQEECDMLSVGGTGKGMTGRVTPFLDSLSEDFTKKVQTGKIENIVGRETEIRKIADLLSGTRKNILIIGSPGSGKTSIVRGIAYKIIEGTEYKAISNRRLVSLDIGALIAGAKTAGDISQKLNKALEEVKGSGDIILFVDEIHNLVAGAGDSNAEISTIYSILEPHLISDDIQFIGATSIPNYRKYIEPNGAFSRLFQLVEIKEASKEDTLEILKDRARKAKEKSKVFVTYPALVKTVALSEKLIHERVLPDKALDVLNRAVSEATQSNRMVNSKVIEQEISEMTNIPSEIISQTEADKLLQVEEEMKKMVVGQDHAIKQIGAALKRARVGIRNENKPIASFLFVGTTGVGKTQTAKALAKSYFGDAKAMIRVDMSEYQQADSISRLIGNPDGSSKGILTEAVRTKPFSLILLDEIEKAHPNILLTFLQVLDEGRLTDSSGAVANFTSSIIIATSNVGTRAIQEVFQKGGSLQDMDTVAQKEVRDKFAPEFLNRFSGIIVFNPLTKEDVSKISMILLNDVKNVAEEKGIRLTFKKELIDELVNRGFNAEWGARPLTRTIEDTVESYIATKMLEGEMKQGDEVNIGLEVFDE